MATPTSPTIGRSNTSNTDDDTQLGEDTSEVTKLFHERLQAWKHACGYIEDYVKSTEKMQVAHGKEYEKVLKTINNPLKEGDHFDRNPGGIAGLFDSMRVNTQSISNAHTQTAQSLKISVLPVFERLHNEIKAKQKELAKGVGKGNKAVDKAKADTSKHVDLLSSNTSSYDRLGAKDSNSDPYVLQRGLYYRLNKQFEEENSNKQDMLSVQSSFSQFESHIVATFQQGLGLLTQTVGTQSDQQKQFYANIGQTASAIDPNHEWEFFIQRNSNNLIDPNAPPKTLANASFPGQDHYSTKPLCQGVLERKQGVLRKFDSSHYAVTPAGFLHEYKTEDDLAKDPTPDLSIYLPDCTIGNLAGNLFTIKAKDVSKGKVGSVLSTTKEYEFRAVQGHDAETWYGIIQGIAGHKPGDTLTPTLSPPTSPPPQATLVNRDREPAATAQTTGTTTGVTQVPQTAGAATTQMPQAAGATTGSTALSADGVATSDVAEARPAAEAQTIGNAI